MGLHNSIRTWLLVIYAADHGSLYINHKELTYRFHLFMLAIIYNATVWPCVINILNSNYISSTRHSVLLVQHAFASKMLISVFCVRHRRGWKSLNEGECRARGSVIKGECRDENMSLMLQPWDDVNLKYLRDQT